MYATVLLWGVCLWGCGCVFGFILNKILPENEVCDGYVLSKLFNSFRMSFRHIILHMCVCIVYGYIMVKICTWYKSNIHTPYTYGHCLYIIIKKKLDMPIALILSEILWIGGTQQCFSLEQNHLWKGVTVDRGW